MPSLRVLGKRTVFSSDDIQNETKCAIIFRFVQICLAVPLLVWLTAQADEIDERWDTNIDACLADGSDFQYDASPRRLRRLRQIGTIFSAVSLGTAFCGLVLYIWTYRTSFKGSPTNTSARKAVDILCNLDVTLLGAARIANFAFGALLAALFVDYCQCILHIEEESGGRFLYGRYISSQEVAEFRVLANTNIGNFRSTCSLSGGQYQPYVAIFAGLVTCLGIDSIYICFVVFCALTQFVSRTNAQLIEAESRWHTCLFCCVGCLSFLTCNCLTESEVGTSQGDFKHMAHMLDRLFDTDTLDITVSDLLVGLRITKLIHYEVEYMTRKQVASAEGQTHILLNSTRKEATITDDEVTTEIADPEIKESSGSLSPVPNLVPAETPVENRRAGLVKRQSRMPIIPSDASVPAVGNMGRSKRRGLTDFEDNLKSAMDPIENQSTASRNEDDDKIQNVRENFNAVGMFIRPNARTALSVKRPEDREIISEACRYISFATNIYTWSLYDKKVKSFSLCRGAVESGTNNYFDPEHKSDHAGRAMIVAPIDGVAEKDILYANYECDVVKCPFAVVLDHKWNSVVVTIRGSTTIDDFVTDMTVDEVELTEWGKRCGFDGEGRFAHRGFLDSSAWIYDIIEKQGVLAKLSKSRLYKHYRLRIVGHSLGAGVSSILALFYRLQFPTVRAIAFEPPGCTMSSNLAAESKEWTLSFVNATDVVPRMNFASIVELRDEVLFNIARIKVNKQDINVNRNVHKRGIRALRVFLKNALHPEEDFDKDTPYMKGLVALRKNLNTRLKQQLAKGKTYDLVIPGKTVCFLPSIAENVDPATQKSCCDSAGAVVEAEEPHSASAIYTDAEVDYQNIILSENFVREHLTSSIEEILAKLAKSFNLKPPFYYVNGDEEIGINV